MRFVILLSLFLFSLALHGQDSSNVANEEVNILFRNEAAGGIVLHSSGVGLTFKRGWHLTGYKKQILDIEFVSLRHPKQYKLANRYYADAKPFFFGKLNYAYILRTGYGRQNVLFSKGDRSGVEVRYNYFAGFSLGITKPVYLEILVDNPDTSLPRQPQSRRFDPNDPDQSEENIYGPGAYFDGLDELSVYPGLYAKFSMSFEYAGWQTKVTAIETGVVLDAYAKPIPIMANNPKDYLFFNFFVALVWGGKW